jgi:CDP-diacylglycerol--glycerol-3-phosphate 3-phosphatidyltransferase
MLTRRLEEKIRGYSELFVRHTLGGTRVPADALTFMTLVFTFGVVWLLAQGALLWAGILFLIASAFDMLDGALARNRGTAHRFGAFLDSTIDRYSEMLVFLGLLLYYYLYREASSPIYSILIFVASHGSVLTSYIRARAEALDFDGRGGLVERPGRVILLVLGMCTGWITESIVILAVLTHISALQRFMRVWFQRKGGYVGAPHNRLE